MGGRLRRQGTSPRDDRAPAEAAARSEAEIAFMDISPGAGRRLKRGGPAGATRTRIRIRAKMARAVEPATVLGDDKLGQAFGLAATAGRVADENLPSILGHIADSRPDTHAGDGWLCHSGDKERSSPEMYNYMPSGGMGVAWW
ncbi:hypothetical protein ACFWHQ_07590 [Streptomyces sp. NPDC060334]|uniref:hypothetical protein n=1 Tax=Streptomyces sp. NPDC060334 TaxID=3347099 RepID=UPI00365FFCA6